MKKYKQNPGQTWDIRIFLRAQLRHKTSPELRIGLFKSVETEIEKVEKICDMIYETIT